MKVKLLKKVRKRYLIERIDNIGTRPSFSLQYWKEELGCPFFIVTDTHEMMGFRTQAFKNKDASLNRVVQLVRLDYKEKFKNKNLNKTKVWYEK